MNSIKEIRDISDQEAGVTLMKEKLLSAAGDSAGKGLYSTEYFIQEEDGYLGDEKNANRIKRAMEQMEDEGFQCKMDREIHRHPYTPDWCTYFIRISWR